MQPEDLCEKIQTTPAQFVVVLAGGGSTALAPLLARGGGSRNLLAGHIPYDIQSLSDFLQISRTPHLKACAASTSLAMGLRAFFEARSYQPSPHAIGVGLTCILPLRGPERVDRQHRLFCSYQRLDRTVCYALTLAPGYSREEAEPLARNLFLNTLAEACGISDRLPLPLREGDTFNTQTAQATAAMQAVLLGTSPAHALIGSPSKPKVLFSSSCNPFHRGHVRMMELAAQETGHPVSVEIPLFNADKPPVDYISLQHRVASVTHLYPVKSLWITGLRTFSEKARHFGGDLWFVIGEDTAQRICQPQFYPQGVEAALEELRDLRCRFLCFARGEKAHGVYPEAFRAITTLLPPSKFLDPISSTLLREQKEKLEG